MGKRYTIWHRGERIKQLSEICQRNLQEAIPDPPYGKPGPRAGQMAIGSSGEMCDSGSHGPKTQGTLGFHSVPCLGGKAASVANTIANMTLSGETLMGRRLVWLNQKFV